MHCDWVITKIPDLNGILVLFHVHLEKPNLNNLSRDESNINRDSITVQNHFISAPFQNGRRIVKVVHYVYLLLLSIFQGKVFH